MTKLEAVNYVMTRMGMYHVAALDTGGASEAGYIEKIIDEVEMEVQADGWHYNRHRKRDIQRDSNDNIPVPTGTLAIWDTEDQNWMNITQLGGFLYNLDEETDVFDTDVDAVVTLRYQWACIPVIIRQYIASRAAVRYCENRGVRDRIAILRDEESKRMGAAKRFNNRSRETNLLDTADARNVRGQRRTYRRLWQ